jgi:hypothetical protein
VAACRGGPGGAPSIRATSRLKPPARGDT